MRRLKRCLFIIIAVVFLAPALAFASIETAIVDYTNAHKEAQLDLLEQLVNINSGTANIAGVKKVGAILQAQFEQLGFHTYWVDGPSYMHHAGTLIVEHSGSNKNRILLIGHLDTVFAIDSAFQKFQRIGNKATGPGVIDIKGGDVIILYALRALKAADVLKNATITVILTGDEEESGKPTSISRKPLIDAAAHHDVALDFESAISVNTATIARRGIANWLLETHGNEAHSSQVYGDKVGFGAIFEMSRILDAIGTQLAKEKYLTINPGIILAGTRVNYDDSQAQGMAFGKVNVVAQKALAKGDLRFISQDQKNNAQKQILNIVQQNLPGTSATIRFKESIPAMPPSSNNLALLKVYSEASQALGYGPVKPLDPGLRGAGDISHIAAIIPACLAGLGALGTHPHSVQEELEVDSLTRQTQRAALLIYKLTLMEARSL